MTGPGALPLAEGSSGARAGLDVYRPDASVGHALLPDGRVHIRLPATGILSDTQACRLAWGILADLAPDEVVPAAVVVTYKEAQRLAVLRAIAAGARTSQAIASVLNWSLRTAQRRACELVGDGRLMASRAGSGDGAIKYFLHPREGA